MVSLNNGMTEITLSEVSKYSWLEYSFMGFQIFIDYPLCSGSCAENKNRNY